MEGKIEHPLFGSIDVNKHKIKNQKNIIKNLQKSIEN